MDGLNSYEKLVIETILSCKDFDIKEVNNIVTIKSLIFIQDQYNLITDLIKKQDWENIKTLENNSNEFNEYLEIIKFTDQNKKTHIATIYDSDELWQDPQVIDIFLQIEK